MSGLKSNGVEILECRTDKSGLLKYFDLIKKHWKIRNDYDVMLVAYPGFQSVILVKFLTSQPIIFDAFASLYDSMVMDRKNVKIKSFTAKYYWWLDKISMIFADIILFDTNEHINYASNEFGIKKEKFRRIFIGADISIFYPNEKENRFWKKMMDEYRSNIRFNQHLWLVKRKHRNRFCRILSHSSEFFELIDFAWHNAAMIMNDHSRRLLQHQCASIVPEPAPLF